MTTSKWTYLDLDPSKLVSLKRVRGGEVALEISPYDLPQAVRGFYCPGRGVFRIEFRYSDEETGATTRLPQDECVSFEIGMHSRKLLAIEVAVDRCDVTAVRLSIAGALDRAGAAIQRLRETSDRPSAQLNYEAVEQVFQANRGNLELASA